MKSLVGILALAIPSLSAVAHHSPNVHFDRNEVVEIEGLLTEVDWQNPHIRLMVVARGADGRDVEWQVEESNINLQLRRGVTRDAYQVGENIRVAGFRGLRNRNAIFATNTLLANGRELVGGTSSGPRWSSDLVMTVAAYQAAKLGATATGPDDIFRVWSVAAASRDPGASRAASPLWKESYPLTEQALATLTNWDPVSDNRYLNCEHGMPAIMDSGAPMEFVREGSDILLRLEEQDVVRRIRMESETDSMASSPYGHSIGRWDGDTLVVTTADIDWPWFDQSGVPQSAELRLTERFTTSGDGRYLDYSLEASDPAVFTEAVLLEKRWAWIPGEELKPYNCSYERVDL